jgi:malonyl-CoA/methylmalonyl-CoA synthetase
MPASSFLARFDELFHARADRTALFDARERLSFGALGKRVAAASACLRSGRASLDGERVVLLVAPGAPWVEAFLGTISAGGVAVPLSHLYPAAELVYFVEDADASTVVVSPEYAERVRTFSRGRRVLTVDELRAVPPTGDARPADDDDVALMLYTSGTTGKPKGAMITHANLATQARLLGDAWGWSEGDVLLHALPLHHLHGLGIALMTALVAGAAARMLERFDAAAVWESMADATVFMGVPTMYHKLLDAFDAADEATRERWAKHASSLRLSTSGSAALPVGLSERWRAITGSLPLERFGMTEIGVGMTNPLAGPRKAGSVGVPLPTVELRILDDARRDVATGESGELWIRGPSVFKGYWRKEEATQRAFVDGWFRTGDIGVRDTDGYVRLLGRSSVDILKSGGYKLSALEIEDALREHDAIAEVAVVGIADAEWGELVVAAIVARPGRERELEEAGLRAWAKERLAPYKVPRKVVLLPELPRNAVGKVLKPELKKLLEARR